MKITLRERSQLLSILKQFSGQFVIVLGDMVADEFIYGEIARVSREAPVLILRERERRVIPGGGANAANNLCDLGAQVLPVGVVGEDAPGEALVAYFGSKGVPTESLVRVAGYTTPTKTRILGGLAHWQQQQVVRVDREPKSSLDRRAQNRLIEAAGKGLMRASAMLVSDYGYGGASPRAASLLKSRIGRGRFPFTADSRYRLGSYRRMTAATPNEPEVEAIFGEDIGNRADRLNRLGEQLRRRLQMKALLVTRGRDGMVLFEQSNKPETIPIFGSDQAVDVTGAGDTVIAAFTLALGAGATFRHAAMLANVAAGLSVMKRGTATVTAREIEEALKNG